MSLIPVCRSDVSFSVAFWAARDAGSDVFIWRGKKYRTKTREENGLPVPPKKPIIIGWETSCSAT